MTKDAERFLCICYNDYLSKVKSGSSKTDACMFSKTYKNENKHFSNWHEDDFSKIRFELNSIGFIKLYVSGSFVLLPDSIEYMENRFKNNLKEIAEVISGFIP